MDGFQVENLYKVNGLNDYRLKTPEDILKIHGIDYKAVDGYNRLDDINREIYKKFIVDIFNAFGLESRSTLFPKGIYYVEQTDYLVKENPEDDYYIIAGGVALSIDRSGLKSVLHKWEDEDYKNLEIVESEPKRYLRFEYEHQDRKEWLHVINGGTEWY